MEQKSGFKEVFLRLVAIVGLIAVLILGAWGIILLAFNVVGFFTSGGGIASLFPQKNTPQVVVQENNTPTKAQTPAKPAVGGAQPTAVYMAAPTRTQLYGLPDLQVTIGSITSFSSVQGRTSVQFVVENIGTNVALSGWTFNASLPLTPAYTYQSGAQQALYPGDKIAFTLTYDDPNFRYNPGQVCTMQYPNYNCNYNYGTNYPQYQQPQTCYTYNGYQNIPGPCYQYDNNSNPYNPNYNYYGNQQNQYNSGNPNYNYYNNGYYPYTSRTVTITLDPQNWVPEAVEYNNFASKNF